MLFDTIGTQSNLTQASVIAKYWGGKIESIPHPKYSYGCDAYPTGWMEITPAEFARSIFFSYPPQGNRLVPDACWRCAHVLYA